MIIETKTNRCITITKHEWWAYFLVGCVKCCCFRKRMTFMYLTQDLFHAHSVSGDKCKIVVNMQGYGLRGTFSYTNNIT